MTLSRPMPKREAPSIRRRNFSRMKTHTSSSMGTGFHCVKQLDGSVKEAYYALHHLKGIVRDCEKTKIPSGLAEYTKMADGLTDADYRTDFHRIRLQLSTIILEDVIHKSGSFHYPRCRALLSITSVLFCRSACVGSYIIYMLCYETQIG